MPPLTLPKLTPTSLRAFALVASTGIGLTMASTVAGVQRDKRWLLLTLPFAAGLAAPALRDPWLADMPYRGWNRLSRNVGRFADRYVSRVAYEALRATSATSPATRGSEALRGQPAWVERHTQPSASYPNQDSIAGRTDGLDAFERYVRQPSNDWAEAIRPVVRLLAAIETEGEEDEAPPTDVYTLY